ncbi:MAG: hypothetical protein ACXIT9_07150 [Nitritalea sp.]
MNKPFHSLTAYLAVCLLLSLFSACGVKEVTLNVKERKALPKNSEAFLLLYASSNFEVQEINETNFERILLPALKDEQLLGRGQLLRDALQKEVRPTLVMSPERIFRRNPPTGLKDFFYRVKYELEVDYVLLYVEQQLHTFQTNPEAIGTKGTFLLMDARDLGVAWSAKVNATASRFSNEKVILKALAPDIKEALAESGMRF